MGLEGGITIPDQYAARKQGSESYPMMENFPCDSDHQVHSEIL